MPGRGETRSAARCHPCDFETGLPTVGRQRERGRGGERENVCVLVSFLLNEKTRVRFQRHDESWCVCGWIDGGRV